MVAQLVKNLPAKQETPVWFLGLEDLLEKRQVTHSSILGFPCGSAGKESTCSVVDLGSIPGLGRYPREEKGYPLQYSGLENSMNCIVHGVPKSWTWLSHFTFIYLRFQFNWGSHILSDNPTLNGLQLQLAYTQVIVNSYPKIANFLSLASSA